MWSKVTLQEILLPLAKFRSNLCNDDSLLNGSSPSVSSCRRTPVAKYFHHCKKKLGTFFLLLLHPTALLPWFSLVYFLHLHLLRLRHQDVLEGSNLRAPLQELHQMVMTPIKAFVGGEEVSAQRPLLASDGTSAAPGSHLSTGGEAESSSSAIAEGDLPGQFTRVMGKGVHPCLCLCVRASLPLRFKG